MKYVKVSWITRYYEHQTKVVFIKDFKNFQDAINKSGGLVLGAYKVEKI